jgi:hypothetical protein
LEKRHLDLVCLRKMGSGFLQKHVPRASVARRGERTGASTSLAPRGDARHARNSAFVAFTRSVVPLCTRERVHPQLPLALKFRILTTARPPPLSGCNPIPCPDCVALACHRPAVHTHCGAGECDSSRLRQATTGNQSHLSLRAAPSQRRSRLLRCPTLPVGHGPPPLPCRVHSTSTVQLSKENNSADGLSICTVTTS